MNSIAEEIKSYFGFHSLSEEEKEEVLKHYGTPQQFDFDPHGSGRLSARRPPQRGGRWT